MKLHRKNVQKNRRSTTSAAGRAPGMVERLESRMLLAAAPTVVRDPSAAGSFVDAGDRAFFTESAANLYVTNGTAGGTFFLRDFGKVGGITGVGDDVYLTTDSGVWRSDGTPAGTVHVLPMYNNIDGIARASGFTELGGEVYFYAQVRNGANGGWQYGLWKTDGTPGGTSLVRAIHSAESLTRVGDSLFFIGDDEQGTGKELWKSDGTLAGTAMVKDIHPTHGGITFVGSDAAMAAVGDRLVFKAHDGTSPYYSLWSSDGTEGGTLKISDARPHRDFTAIGGVAYFGAGSAAGTGELWKTDGTTGGTTLVKDLGTMSASQLLDVGGTLYFAGPDGDRSASLWRSNGSAAGTARVAGPAEGNPFGGIFDLREADGTLVFIASDPAVLSGAYSFWTSDGTTVGTVKVGDTFTGGMQGAPGKIGVAGSVALFTANDGVGAPTLLALQTATPPPLPEAQAQGPYPYVVGEGNTLNLHGFTTAEPLPGRPLTYTWDLDDDGVFGETGAAAQHGDEIGTDPTFNAAGLDGPSTHVVRFRISDSIGYSSTDAAGVTIRNGQPTLNVTGGPSVLTEGNVYTLNLSTADGGPDTISQWMVDWGDGVMQTLPGNTNSVTHTYPAGHGTYGITVIAQDEDGEYRADPLAALDAGFGSNGIVTSDLTDRDDTPRGVAVQPDGKIVTVSTLQLSAQHNHMAIAINRYLPDGALDPTFGVGGRVQFNIGYTSATSASAVALQPDGRIVVVGSTGPSISSNSLVLRLLPDGSFDPSFGDTGWVAYDFGTYEHLAQLKIKADGRIVAGGIANQKLLLAQFEPDGSLDAGFGTGGSIIVNDVSANAGGIRDMVLQPDGKIVAAPYIYLDTPEMVMRFNADGSPDTTFDGDGRVPMMARALALTSDGRILVAGNGLVRLNTDGSPDLTFGTNGTQPLQYGVNPVMHMLRDGRVVIAGTSVPNDFHVVRYNANGTLDPTFAPPGGFIVNTGGTGIYATFRDMVLQPDGAPILYGGAGTAHNPTEALIRLTPTGLSVRVVDAGTPQLSISAPPSASETATYTLGLSATDPDGDGITQWIINWGDGSVQVIDGNPSSVTHVYADGPRDAMIKASALDGDRSISSVSANVSVDNVPPTITVTGGAPAAEGSPYTVEFSATDPGPDTITHWRINWGDGKFSSLPAGATSAQHTYLDDGDYTVIVSATDEDGTFPAAPVTAVITNVPPTLDPLGDRRAAAGADFRLTFTARDVVPEVFSGTIDWGDGSEPTPFTGFAATPLAANSFAVDHTYAGSGTYVVIVNLSDGDGGTTTGTASVEVGDLVVRVFDDMNGNGFRDTGDPARTGAIAFLDLDRDGARDAGEPTGTTDAFGDALFEGLPASAHAARVVVPPNWHLSTPTAGFIDATPGTVSALATFGLTRAATATGTLFDDANANGMRDADEGPLWATVSARRVDTNATVFVAANAQGFYRFSGLLPGQYVIGLTSTSRVTTAPYGYRGHLVMVTGEEAEFAGLDIGSFAGPGGTVGGTLYRDLNGNGMLDVDEPGVSRQVIYVDVNDNGMRDLDELSGLTNSSGAWSISRLPAGTYRLRQVLPPGAPGANDPAVSREVTVALGQTISGIHLARPYERTYYIRRSGSNVVVYNGSEAGQFIVSSAPLTSTTPLAVLLSPADDWVIIDWTVGSPIPAGGLQIDCLGGEGDTLSLIGTSAADVVTFAAGGITLGDASVSHANVERITFDGNGGSDDVTITDGPPVTLAGAQDVAPRVTGVFISGTAWTSGFLKFLASSGVGVESLGYRLDATAHADELPWINLNKISVRFSEDVNLAPGALRVFGVNVPQYAGSVTYDPATFTATFQLTTGVFAAEKLLIALDDTLVTDSNGSLLDGEWANPAETTPITPGGADAYPSGDGIAGGDFAMRLNVLPGDVNRDGRIVGNDVTSVRGNQGFLPGGSGYTIFRDVTGDGRIVGNDVTGVRSRQGITLPVGVPLESSSSRVSRTSSLRLRASASLFASSTPIGKAFGLLGKRFDLFDEQVDPLLPLATG